MNLDEVKAKIIPVLRENRVEYAGVFGSVARGEARPDSDVDILVKFTGPATFSAYLKLDEELHKTLRKDVDLVTEGAVNKYLKPQIERDIKIIYGQR